MYQFSLTPTAGNISPALIIGLIALMLWTVAWKGWSLWLSARRKEKIWFVVMLFVNTFGILDIIYIFFIAKQKDIKEEKSESTELSNSN